MSKKFSGVTIALVLMVVVSIWAIGSMDASAQVAHQGQENGMHAGHGHDHGSATRAGDAPRALRSPHGGQMTVAGLHCFEVVYRPKETRVYLYDADHRPISARGVQGQVSLKVQGNEKVFRYPLSYAAPRAGSARQDYLAMALNVSRIRDGQMAVTLALGNLPDRRQPQATFTQTFALSKIPVTVALLDASDRPRIEQQKVCPVTNGRLGSMGTPVKVMIGDQSIYLCCKGCLGKVQKNPELYLQKAAPAGSHAQAASAGRLIVATATTADQAAITRQRVCVVTGGKLGAMGTPIKMTAGGQSLFVCCKGCVGKVKKNPSQYLAKAAELRAGR